MINSTSQEKHPLHLPVMLSEVLEYLDLQENGVYIDGTVGAGGHAKSIIGDLIKKKKESDGASFQDSMLKLLNTLKITS